jgi:PAS domain S-box-containing protein
MPGARFFQDLRQAIATSHTDDVARHYREVIGNLNDLFYALNRDGRIVYASRAVQAMLGYTQEEVSGRLFHEFVVPEDLPGVVQEFERLIDTRTSRYEFRLLAKSGEERWVRTSSQTLAEDGTVIGVFGVLIDITERKSAEMRLEESESRLRAITQSAMDAILMIDPAGGISFWNPAAERILGYKATEVMGANLHDLIAPGQYKSPHREAFARFQQTGQGRLVGRTVELDARRKDGTVIPVALSLSAVQLRGAWHAVGILRDTSDTKRSAERLHASWERMRLILDHAPDAFLTVNERLTITDWNARAASLTGWPMAEAIGSPLSLIMPPRYRGAPEDAARWGLAIHPGKVVSQNRDTTITSRDGREVPVAASIWSTQAQGCWQANLYLRDLTESCEAQRELMALEMQLRQAQKLEAVGALAAGIAHEINTPIQYVGDNVRFLGSAFKSLDAALGACEAIVNAPDPQAVPITRIAGAREVLVQADLPYLREEVPAAIAQAQEGVQRVTAIVRAMKEFSHPGPCEMSPADINGAIESTATVCRNEWKYVADLVLDLDPGMPAVPCLIGEVKQVILNLIVNAAHAIEDGRGRGGTKGTITIASRLAGLNAEIRVRDNGSGIPHAIRDRLFDPFFTTKPVGKGTGQGLAIAHQVIVVKHGGGLSFTSEIGVGTEFTVLLPLERPNEEHGGAAHEEAHSVRG